MESANEGSTASARDRIRMAYDPALLRTAGERLAQELGRHMAFVQASGGSVLNWFSPQENIARATHLADNVVDSVDPTELVSRFERIVHEMLARGHNLHDPRYVGHQVPAPIPLAGLFDAVGSVTNQVMAVYEMGPWSTAVELAMVSKLAGYLGWRDGEYAGLVTHGGSLANLNALLVARNVTLQTCWEQGLRGTTKPPVLVVQSDTHYSIARTAGILGVGTRQVIKVGLDDRRRMNVVELEQTLAHLQASGHPIIAVVACACSTPIGAFDPLNSIADICEKHGVWLHVDAAHGGSALLSPTHRHLVAGLERADSLVWDAHKMLFVPALCAFLYFKQRKHSYDAFQQHAPYLFDPTAPGLAEYDLGLRTVECTKRAAAYGLWGAWSLFGAQLFTDLVDVTFDLGRELYEKLVYAPDFEPLHHPECNIVVFRHLPPELDGATPAEQGQFQRRLRRRVIESGEFYLVATNLDGTEALRVTLINPLTTAEHLDQLLETLRRMGREILS
ncbi:MAG: aminotransferase class I/II-fold pyridoxal phosphate-dependent enzyme [Planctomycetes bacterium]|nr:aminotransferase class I/II-fold pyridoxal phosphate-dependent enzyme [Planctomycetota bacterium]